MLLSWINIRRIMEFFSNANRACHPLNNVDSVSRQISSVQLYFFNLCLFIWLHQGLAVARRISAVSCVIFHCGTQALTSWSVLAWFFQGIWNLSSLTRNWTYVLCIGRQILNHWTTRKVPSVQLLTESFNIENICGSQPSISPTIFYKKNIMIINSI